MPVQVAQSSLSLGRGGKADLGFQPIRTRIGVAYADDCIEFGATWRRDFIDAGDARRGNAFQVFFALRNLGFR